MLKMFGISWGKLVCGVLMFGGKNTGLYRVVVLCLLPFVSFYRSLYELSAGFLTSFFHVLRGAFISVVGVFLPTFPITNNKRLLSFNIVINCRRLV